MRCYICDVLIIKPLFDDRGLPLPCNKCLEEVRDALEMFESDDDYGNLRSRLMNEVTFALEDAMAVVDYVEDRHLEIPLDLNPDPKHK